MGVIKTAFGVAAVEIRGSVNLIEATDFLGSGERIFLHAFPIGDAVVLGIVVVVHGDVNRLGSRRSASVNGVLFRGGRGRGRSVGSCHR